MSHYVKIRDGMSSADEGDLQGVFTSFLLRAGVLDKSGGHYTVTEKGTPDMSVDVATGVAFVENTSWSEFSSETKYWQTILDASVNKAISSNSSGSTRIDLVCIKIDTGASPDANASNVASAFIVEGTPGAGAPATPNDHLKLAEVTVADGETSITNAEISDSRVQSGLDLSLATLENTGIVQGLDSGGTLRDLVELTSGDVFKVGQSTGVTSAFVTDVKARAYANTAQSISGGPTKVQLDTESYDPGSNFDAATNYRFTAPVTGYYSVHVHFAAPVAGDQEQLVSWIYVNGSEHARNVTFSSGASTHSNGLSDIISLNANDYVEYFVTTAGQIVAGSNNTFMAIHLLSID